MRNGAGSGDAPPGAMLGSAFCIRPAGYARRTITSAMPRAANGTIWLTSQMDSEQLQTAMRFT
jgi:hypothetical protein